MEVGSSSTDIPGGGLYRIYAFEVIDSDFRLLETDHFSPATNIDVDSKKDDSWRRGWTED
jgi:hypothetical protein